MGSHLVRLRQKPFWEMIVPFNSFALNRSIFFILADYSFASSEWNSFTIHMVTYTLIQTIQIKGPNVDDLLPKITSFEQSQQSCLCKSIGHLWFKKLSRPHLPPTWFCWSGIGTHAQCTVEEFPQRQKTDIVVCSLLVFYFSNVLFLQGPNITFLSVLFGVPRSCHLVLR